MTDEGMLHMVIIDIMINEVLMKLLEISMFEYFVMFRTGNHANNIRCGAEGIFCGKEGTDY